MSSSPLTELHPNIIRQGSRSSNITTSVKDGISQSLNKGPANMGSSTTGNAAVLSMLKTTTETGDLGCFSMGSGRLPKLPRGLSRPAPNLPGSLAHSSSRASSRYSRNGSVRESIRSGKSQRSGGEGSIPGAWPYGQHQFSNSQEFPRPPSDARSSAAPGSMRSVMMSGHDRFDTSERSQSLTRTLPYARTFSDNRSVSSFRSQEPITRPESPFVQANRLQYARNRPSSPARSDTAGGAHHRRQVIRHRTGLRAHTAMALPPQSASDFSRTAHPDFAAYPPPNPRFRPSRTIEDLRRPFVAGGQSNDFRPPDRQMPFRVPQPLPTHYRQADFGPPLPHAHMLHSSPRPLQYDHEDTTRSSYRAGPSDITPYKGFVQRVKNALEERTSTEEIRPHLSSHNTAPEQVDQKTMLQAPEISTPKHVSLGSQQLNPAGDSGAEPQDLEQAVPEIVEGSPSVKRLTRDMIKAGMDGMSDVVAMSDVAEEGMATSIINMDEDEQGRSSSGESDQSLRRLSAVDTKSAPFGGATADGNTSSDETVEKPLSPGTSSDFMNYSLRMSKPHLNVPTDNRSEPLLVNGNLNEKGEMRKRFLLDDSATLGVSYRHSGMPSEATSQQPRPRRSTMTKSMPMPSSSSGPDSAQTNQTNDLDDQKAIRLSSIEPSVEAGGPKEEVEAVVESTSSTSSSTNGITRSSTIVNQTNKDLQHNAASPTVSVRSSAAIADEQTDMTTGRFQESFSPTADTIANLSKRNATLIDASRSTMGAPCRSSAHVAESRISAMKNFHFPMPDLTEDSQEDASTTNLRILGMRAPVPRPRPPKDFRRQHHMPIRAPPPAPREIPRSYLKRAAADLHHIPSFNFSRVDLTTKLNNALGLRFSRSAGDLTELTSSSAAPSLPDRPMSQVMVRETYRSFFAANEASIEEDEALPIERTTVKSDQFDEELLSELEKLSIPSVKHLTARLSELLPSIKQSRSELDLELVDEALRQTVMEMRQLGSLDEADRDESDRKSDGGKILSSPLTRPGTANSKATRASHRRERRKSLLHLMKELPPLPAEKRYGCREDTTMGSANTSIGSSDDRSTPEDVSELDGTAVDVTGSVDANDSNEADAGKARRNDSLAKRARPSPGTTPRPWNKNESYPWTEEVQPVDITVSTNRMDEEDGDAAQAQGSRVSRQSRDTARQNSMRIVRSMSPGFDADLIPGTDDALLIVEHQGSSKHGLLNAFTRRMARKPKQEKAGFAVDPLFFHPEEHSVGAGDRYPTTSLSSPAGLAVDEGRSYFSDDSSLSDHARARLRKRLTRLRPRLTLPNGGSPAASPSDSQTEVGRLHPHDEPQHVEPRAVLHRSIVSSNNQPAEGMGKTEFRAKRLVEKIRVLLFKSGERLRHIGKGKKREVWYNAEEVQPISA